MSVLSGLYLAVSEIALWLFVYTATSAYIPSPLVAPVVFTVAIYWRFGRTSLVSMLTKGFRPSIALGVLVISALSSYGPMIQALVSSPSSILTPFTEEVVYQYVLPRIFESRVASSFKHRRLVSVVAPAVLFCFAHRHGMDLASADMAVCLISGLALNLRANKNKSLLETFTMHALHNLHVIAGQRTGEAVRYPHLPSVVLYGGMLVQDLFSK